MPMAILPLLLHTTSVLLIFLLLSVRPGAGCVISGTDSGYCTKAYLPSTYGEDIKAIERARSLWDCRDDAECIPFCGKYVATYPLCLPRVDNVAPDQNFPKGRFGESFNTLTKDMWIEETALATIASNPELFSTNADCQDSYKRYICYLNYPRCDDNENSLPLCSSVCENFVAACGLDNYKEFCTNDAAGTSVSTDGATSPITTGFPGQPFVANKFLPKSRGQPDLVCTPSVKNGSPGGGRRWWLVAVIGSTSSLLLAHITGGLF